VVIPIPIEELEEEWRSGGAVNLRSNGRGSHGGVVNYVSDVSTGVKCSILRDQRRVLLLFALAHCCVDDVEELELHAREPRF
jgi:hypothetical protein